LKEKKTQKQKILIFFSLKRKQQCFHFIFSKFSFSFLIFFIKGILVIGGMLTSFDSLEGTLSQLKIWQTLSIRW
jgi:hypothetical protein